MLALDSHAFAHHSFEGVFIGFVSFQQFLKQFVVRGKGKESAELLLDSELSVEASHEILLKYEEK